MADNNPPSDANPNPPRPSGGPRTLGGDPAPESASSSSSRPRQAPQRGLRTLRDLQNESGGHGHSHGDGGDDASDEDDKDENQDFFTGGEKSGLAVQNPGAHNARDHINNILKRARE
jgi:UBX domain-containing protein 1